MVSLADHLLLANAGHFFHGSIPGNNLLVLVENEGRVWQKIYNVCKFLL